MQIANENVFCISIRHCLLCQYGFLHFKKEVKVINNYTSTYWDMEVVMSWLDKMDILKVMDNLE